MPPTLETDPSPPGGYTSHSGLEDKTTLPLTTRRLQTTHRSARTDRLTPHHQEVIGRTQVYKTRQSYPSPPGYKPHTGLPGQSYPSPPGRYTSHTGLQDKTVLPLTTRRLHITHRSARQDSLTPHHQDVTHHTQVCKTRQSYPSPPGGYTPHTGLPGQTVLPLTTRRLQTTHRSARTVLPLTTRTLQTTHRSARTVLPLTTRTLQTTHRSARTVLPLTTRTLQTTHRSARTVLPLTTRRLQTTHRSARTVLPLTTRKLQTTHRSARTVLPSAPGGYKPHTGLPGQSYPSPPGRYKPHTGLPGQSYPQHQEVTSHTQVCQDSLTPHHQEVTHHKQVWKTRQPYPSPLGYKPHTGLPGQSYPSPPGRYTPHTGLQDKTVLPLTSRRLHTTHRSARTDSLTPHHQDVTNHTQVWKTRQPYPSPPGGYTPHTGLPGKTVLPLTTRRLQATHRSARRDSVTPHRQEVTRHTQVYKTRQPYPHHQEVTSHTQVYEQRQPYPSPPVGYKPHTGLQD